MNNKVHFLIIPVLFIFSIGVGLVIIERNRPPVWSDALGRYIKYKSSLNHKMNEVDAVVIARYPHRFSREFSQVSFGASPFFQTDIRYDQAPPDQNTLDMIPGEPPSAGLISLPYPPDKAWCAQLGKGNSFTAADNSLTPVLIVMGFHKDLFHTDIIVHEVIIEPDTQVIEEIISSLGCIFP
jgi:hypothetical protein